MTKVDKVSDGNEEEQKQFKEREQCFIKALGLAGVTTRYLSMSNYCDDADREQKRLTSTLPEIDAPLLRFMTQVSDPAITVANADFTHKQNQHDEIIKTAITFLVIAFVIYFIHFMLQKIVTLGC